MSKLSTGTGVTTNHTFNAGLLTFGTDQWVEVENINIAITHSVKKLNRLNSIIFGAIKRYAYTVSFSAKVKAFSPKIFGYTLGSSSSDGSGTMYQEKDGQYTSTLNPIITVYADDDTTRTIQYQLTDAIIVDAPGTFTMEDFGQQDLKLEARTMTIYTDSTLN